eukprot:8410268-Pyramimonas_sp.AAC.1
MAGARAGGCAQWRRALPAPRPLREASSVSAVAMARPRGNLTSNLAIAAAFEASRSKWMGRSWARRLASAPEIELACSGHPRARPMPWGRGLRVAPRRGGSRSEGARAGPWKALRGE